MSRLGLLDENEKCMLQFICKTYNFTVFGTFFGLDLTFYKAGIVYKQMPNRDNNRNAITKSEIHNFKKVRKLDLETPKTRDKIRPETTAKRRHNKIPSFRQVETHFSYIQNPSFYFLY